MIKRFLELIRRNRGQPLHVLARWLRRHIRAEIDQHRAPARARQLTPERLFARLGGNSLDSLDYWNESDVKVPWELSRLQWLIPVSQARPAVVGPPEAFTVGPAMGHAIAHGDEPGRHLVWIRPG